MKHHETSQRKFAEESSHFWGFFSSQECESEELKESFEDQWIDPNQNKDEDQQNQSELNKIATLDVYYNIYNIYIYVI